MEAASYQDGPDLVSASKAGPLTWTSFVPAQMFIFASGHAKLFRQGGFQPPGLGVSHPVQLRAFAEGAANVLFAIENMQTPDIQGDSPPIPPAHEEYLGGSLLRLRKGNHTVSLSGMQIATSKSPASQDGVIQSAAPPPYVSARCIQDFVNDFVCSRFSDGNIVKHTLVGIEPELLVLCNQHLVEWEEKRIRSRKRWGWFLKDDENTALLVTDMSSRDRSNSFTVELKPKWLCQSPCAPRTARRCRTCAFQEMKDTPYPTRFCPLALCSGNKTMVLAQLSRVTKGFKFPQWISAEQALEVLSDYFCHSQPTQGLHLLRRLAEVQHNQDRDGILLELDVSKGEVSDKTVADALKMEKYNAFGPLSTGMTMRDCTLFLRVTIEPLTAEELQGGITFKSTTVEARLADLDPKVPDQAKLLKWRMDEHYLLTGGYYEATNTSKDMQEEPREEICVLYKQNIQQQY